MTTASQDLDDVCKHDITRRFCGLCNGVAEKFRREHDLEVERVLALEGWFEAKYGGRCAVDNTYYHPGTPIRRSTNLDRVSGKSRYVAMCCAPSEGEV